MYLNRVIIALDIELICCIILYLSLEYEIQDKEVFMKKSNSQSGGNPECKHRKLSINIRNLSLAITFLVSPVMIFAQVDTMWVRWYDGPGNEYDGVEAMALDSSGNVYVTGISYGSTGLQDYCTIKYYANGNTAWVGRYNGSGNSSDDACDIAVDTSGNVYVTGYVIGAGTNVDWATIKYYPNGDTAWVRTYNRISTSQDQAHALAVDNLGNVYVTGFTSEVGGNADYTTIKYEANGDTAWLRRYNGPNNDTDIAQAIAIDTSGYLYVTGYSSGLGTSYDYATIKYNADGDTVWVRRYDGTDNSSDEACDITVDISGNVYVTGASRGLSGYYDYATIKYNADGDTMWGRRYDTPESWDDQPQALAIDDSGNVYVTGYTVDDWYMYCDYLTIKYYPNGDTAWVRRYDGPVNGFDEAYDIAVDASGNVYVTGYSEGAGTNADIATIKYDASGDTVWVKRFNDPGNGYDAGECILVDNCGCVYVGGRAYNSGSSYDYVTIKYGQNIKVEENPEHYVSVKPTMQISPNPACHYCTISFPYAGGGSPIKVFDVTGTQIKSIEHVKGNTKCRVSLTEMRSGIYFVQKDDAAEVIKLIVVK
jgi:uncharacterized delta-60 repeat protein